MQYFFIDEDFYSDLGDLIDRRDYVLKELDDDWSIEVDLSKLEKIFTLKEDFVIDAIMEKTEVWEDRFPEESESAYEKVKNAIRQSIDFKKLNELMPSLYYPNDETCIITKADLIEYAG